MKLKIMLCVLLFGASLVYADSIPILADEPTEAAMQKVRDGAKKHCQQDDEDQRAQCVADYYAQHNLDEEPSCD